MSDRELDKWYGPEWHEDPPWYQYKYKVQTWSDDSLHKCQGLARGWAWGFWGLVGLFVVWLFAWPYLPDGVSNSIPQSPIPFMLLLMGVGFAWLYWQGRATSAAKWDDQLDRALSKADDAMKLRERLWRTSEGSGGQDAGDPQP